MGVHRVVPHRFCMITQELRGNNSIPKLLEETCILSPTKPRIEGTLSQYRISAFGQHTESLQSYRAGVV